MNKKENYSIWTQHERAFIFRRCWRSRDGYNFRKQDLVDAFGMSLKTARRRIQEVLDTSTGETICGLPTVNSQGQPFLIPKGKGIIANRSRLNKQNPLSGPPCASEEDFAEALWSSRDPNLFFCLTGLKTDELKINRYDWLNPLPSTPDTLIEILKALQNQPTLMEGIYTSLSENDTGRAWKFIPLSLQIVGEQISLYVYRLGTLSREEYARTDKKRKWEKAEGERTLVLNRLQHCKKAIPGIKPKELRGLIARLPLSREIIKGHPVKVNPRFTPEQEIMIRDELNIRNGHVHLPHSMLFQFLRIYADQPANGIWPALLTK